MSETPVNKVSASALRRMINGRPVYIWGAKITGRSALAYLKRCALGAPGGFIDRDEHRRKAPLKGLRVAAPDAFFAAHSREDSFVITAGRQYATDMADACKAHGYVENEDFCSAFDVLGPIYELDVVRLCNLRCPSCPQGNWPERPCKDLMTEERFAAILRHILKITPNVAHIGLYSWGEPFLHPQLAAFVRMVREADIPCFLSSNLSHEAPLEPVLLKGVDYFRVSISGYTQPVYEIDHAGGRMDLVKSNLYRLKYYVEKHEMDTGVEVVYHKYNYNLHELPRVEALCEELGFSLATYVASILPNENMIKLMEGEELPRLRPLVGRLLFDLDKLPRQDLRGREDECFAFHNSIGLTPTGQVIVCHNAYDTGESCLGQDFLTMGYDDIIAAKYHNPTCEKCRKWGVSLMYGAIIDDEGNFSYLHKD